MKLMTLLYATCGPAGRRIFIDADTRLSGVEEFTRWNAATFRSVEATPAAQPRIGGVSENQDFSMKMVDHARLVQALQDTSVLVSHNIDAERHSVAKEGLQRSISLLLAELSKDWRDAVPQNTPTPSVGVPD